MITTECFCNSNNWPRRLGKIKKINKKIILFTKVYFDKNYNYFLNLIFTNDKELKKLNFKYKRQKTSTDVLTFVIENNNKKFKNKLCDIFFSSETIIKDAKKNNVDFYEHYTHLLIHSFLHINGYNHKTLSDFKKMQKIEVKILDIMGIKNPYLN